MLLFSDSNPAICVQQSPFPLYTSLFYSEEVLFLAKVILFFFWRRHYEDIPQWDAVFSELLLATGAMWTSAYQLSSVTVYHYFKLLSWYRCWETTELFCISCYACLWLLKARKRLLKGKSYSSDAVFCFTFLRRNCAFLRQMKSLLPDLMCRLIL